MTLQDASRSEPSQAARDAEETIKAAARDVLGQEPIGLERLSGGMNNVLYSFWHAGTRLVGKLYFRHPSDPRDRLSTEFTVLRLLWQRGIRCIPEPVAASQEHGVGFYGFVDGSRCSPGDVQRQDVEDYLLFTRHMWDLSASVAVGAVPKASDAAFSLTDRLKSVAARMEWVKNAVGPGYVEARRF
ncbi:MAG TPA: hypothetical protein VL984_13530, partial [Acidimicrobiales bacterium]|nr:hypothetical protein [Acidimicrobiales bacterium]